MTLEELKENMRKLKLPYLECSLFSPELVPGTFLHDGLYVQKKQENWEVYVCEGPLKMPKAVLFNESDLYEYVFCYYKKIADNRRIF